MPAQSPLIQIMARAIGCCWCHSSDTDDEISEKLNSQTMNYESCIAVGSTPEDVNDLDKYTFKISQGVISSTFSPLENAQEKFRSPIMSPPLKSGTKRPKKGGGNTPRTPSYNYDIDVVGSPTPSVNIAGATPPLFGGIEDIGTPSR